MELRSIQVVNDYIAFNNKSTDFLIAKLGKDVDINAYINRKKMLVDQYQIKIFGMQQYTVLHTAIAKNNVNGVNWVIENGADVNKKMKIYYYKTIYDESIRDYKRVPYSDIEIFPLQLAMQSNFLSIAQILINKGADTSCLSNDEKQKLGIPVTLMTNNFMNYSFYYLNNNNNNLFNPPRP